MDASADHSDWKYIQFLHPSALVGMHTQDIKRIFLIAMFWIIIAFRTPYTQAVARVKNEVNGYDSRYTCAMTV